MSFSCKVEEITPAMAHQFLALSIGNRTLNPDFVLSCAVAMESQKWDETSAEAVFDETGAFIDGHHRMHAIIAYDKPVRMLVKRGVSKAARGLIDTGRTRNISDLMTMFRGDVTNITQRKATLTTCVGLLVTGRRPAIRTLDAYDAWMRQFREGIDACVEISRAGGGAGNPVRLGPITGAFAFAHKTNPKKVEAFLLKVRDGVGLEAREPAHTLLTLLRMPTASVRGHRRADRDLLSRKVLQALLADLKGHSYARAQAGDAGLQYFKQAYDTRATEKLVDMWTPDVSQAAES